MSSCWDIWHLIGAIRTGQEEPWEKMTFTNINGFAFTRFNNASRALPEEFSCERVYTRRVHWSKHPVVDDFQTLGDFQIVAQHAHTDTSSVILSLELCSQSDTFSQVWTSPTYSSERGSLRRCSRCNPVCVTPTSLTHAYQSKSSGDAWSRVWLLSL